MAVDVSDGDMGIHSTVISVLYLFEHFCDSVIVVVVVF